MRNFGLGLSFVMGKYSFCLNLAIRLLIFACICRKNRLLEARAKETSNKVTFLLFAALK